MRSIPPHTSLRTSCLCPVQQSGPSAINVPSNNKAKPTLVPLEMQLKARVSVFACFTLVKKEQIPPLHGYISLLRWMPFHSTCHASCELMFYPVSCCLESNLTLPLHRSLGTLSQLCCIDKIVGRKLWPCMCVKTVSLLFLL